MKTQRLILASLIAIAAVPAFAAVQKTDPYTDGQAITKADPYTDGARADKSDPYTDGGLRQANPYTDGQRTAPPTGSPTASKPSPSPSPMPGAPWAPVPNSRRPSRPPYFCPRGTMPRHVPSAAPSAG